MFRSFCHLVGFILCDVTPRTSLKVSLRFGGSYRLHLRGRGISQSGNQGEALLATCFTLVTCLSYSSTFKIEATCPSEISFDFQRNIRCCILKTEFFLSYCLPSTELQIINYISIFTLNILFICMLISSVDWLVCGQGFTLQPSKSQYHFAMLMPLLFVTTIC
jgi:hypothetical protein